MKTFNEIVTEILKIKESDIKDSLSPDDVPEWDSMNYLMLVAELEDNFAISFTMDNIVNSKTLGDVRKVVESKMSK
jgi:acyl carrier protein